MNISRSNLLTISYPYLSVGRLFRDSAFVTFSVVVVVSLPIGGEVISRLCGLSSYVHGLLCVSLPIGGEVISRLLSGVSDYKDARIPTYRWGGYFETWANARASAFTVAQAYPYLSVGRLFRDISGWRLSLVIVVSLPIGGEVISRRPANASFFSFIHCIPTYRWGGYFETTTSNDNMTPFIKYPYLSVGRLFRDSLPLTSSYNLL